MQKLVFILGSLGVSVCLFAAAGHMLVHQEPVDWPWSFAVFVLLAGLILERNLLGKGSPL